MHIDPGLQADIKSCIHFLNRAASPWISVRKRHDLPDLFTVIVVNTLLQNDFSNPYLSRCNPVSHIYQCLNLDTIWSTIHVNQDTNATTTGRNLIHYQGLNWTQSHKLSMAQLGNNPHYYFGVDYQCLN